MRLLAGWIAVGTGAIALAGPYDGPGPVTEFVARYDVGVTARIRAVASRGARVARKVSREQSSDVLVFDDPTRLHFEGDGTETFDTVATWRPLSERLVLFEFTPETAVAAEAYMTERLRSTTRPAFQFGTARLKFARDATVFRGGQSIRVTGRDGEVRFRVGIRLKFRGTRQ